MWPSSGPSFGPLAWDQQAGMKPNAFVGKKTKPTARDLTEALGSAYLLWQKLIHELGLTPEWNSYSPKAGWSLKLKQKTRTILYLSPSHDGFRAAFVLGDKAIAAARTSDLPKSVLKTIAKATKYPEGTAVRLEDVNSADVDVIKKLAAIKLAN